MYHTNFTVFWKERKTDFRSSPPEVFLQKAVLKICKKFTGEHPLRSVISIKLQSNFIEIALRHGLSPVNLHHIFRAPFYKNIYAELLLRYYGKYRSAFRTQPNIYHCTKSEVFHWGFLQCIAVYNETLASGF